VRRDVVKQALRAALLSARDELKYRREETCEIGRRRHCGSPAEFIAVEGDVIMCRKHRQDRQWMGEVRRLKKDEAPVSALVLLLEKALRDR
jgi:hypothetical protein